jgi:hypothetical protein
VLEKRTRLRKRRRVILFSLGKVGLLNGRKIMEIIIGVKPDLVNE